MTTMSFPASETVTIAPAVGHVSSESAAAVMVAASAEGNCVVHRPNVAQGDSLDCMMRRPTKPGVACSNQAGRTKLEGSKEPPRLAPGSRVVIHQYQVGNRWIDVRDLEQTAAEEALRVAPRPDVRDLDGYQTRAVAYALCRLVAEMRSPVSCPSHEAGAVEELSAAKRAALVGTGEDDEELAEDSRELARVAAETFEPAEDVLHRARLLEQIRQALAEESEAARAVLLDGEKSATVAERLGLTVRQVYSRTEEAMERLRAAFGQMGRAV